MTTASQPWASSFLARLGHGSLVERHQHVAVGVHALGHLEPVLALDQRL